MSDFGDATPDDSYDPTAPADPEAVARIFMALQRRLSGDDDRPEFDELDELERILLIYTIAALLARLRREGSLR